MKRILVASFYNRKAIAPSVEKLSGRAEVIMANDLGRSFTEDEIISHLEGINIVIAAEEPYTERVFSSAPQLEMIARDGVGFDSIDLAAATRGGVIAVNAPVLHESVADLVLGLIIAAVRRIPICDRGAREGLWTERDRFLATDVNGKTLGILGFGRIGKSVARRASAFDMRLLAYDPYVDEYAAGQLGVEVVSLDEVLRSADVLTIHTPLLPETRNLIDAAAISRMKDGAFLINTSRADVVDEAALIDALTSGKLAGAGLDVVQNEPPSPDNPLFAFDNVVFTPHVGSDTFENFAKVLECNTADILGFLAGERPRHVLNPEVFDNIRRKS